MSGMKAQSFIPLLSLLPSQVWSAGTNALNPEKLGYNLQTTVEAYEKIGRKDPKWDLDAKRCLNAFARMRSTTKGAIDESRDELGKILPRLADVKCDDPMIRYLYVRFVFADSHSGSESAATYGDPTGSPLPRPLDAKLIQVHGDGRRLLGQQFSLRGQSAQGLGLSWRRIECLSGLLPTQLLAGAQGAQVEHLPLHDSAITTATVLYQTPVAVDFTIFASFVRTKKKGHEREIISISERTGRG